MLRLNTLSGLGLIRDGTVLDPGTLVRRRLAFLSVLASAGVDATVSRGAFSGA